MQTFEGIVHCWIAVKSGGKARQSVPQRDFKIGGNVVAHKILSRILSKQVGKYVSIGIYDESFGEFSVLF